MVLKQNGVPFVHCPQQGNKIEGVVLNMVCILGILCPKQGQGLKSPSGSTSPYHPPPPGGALLKFSCPSSRTSYCKKFKSGPNCLKALT